MARPNRKRLSMDMPLKMHEELRITAHKYNVSLTVYAIRVLNMALKKEKYYEQVKQELYE